MDRFRDFRKLKINPRDRPTTEEEVKTNPCRVCYNWNRYGVPENLTLQITATDVFYLVAFSHPSSSIVSLSLTVITLNSDF